MSDILPIKNSNINIKRNIKFDLQIYFHTKSCLTISIESIPTSSRAANEPNRTESNRTWFEFEIISNRTQFEIEIDFKPKRSIRIRFGIIRTSSI